MRINQKGLAVIEGILILAIVGIIAGAGYFVYQAQNKAKDTLDKASQTSQSAIPKKKTASTTTPKSLELKEWKVKGSYDSKVSLTYELTAEGDSSLPSYIYFSSHELDAVGPMCVGGHYGGAIDRYKSNDHFMLGDSSSEDSGKTAAEYAATLDAGSYGHVGDYYYFYQSPQAACSDSPGAQDTQGDTQKAVKQFISSLKQA